MAEESTPAPPVGDASKPEDYRNGSGKPQRKPRDENPTPVEDLYDLTKPIPRVRDFSGCWYHTFFDHDLLTLWIASII
jgi:hypothetical protein